MDTIPAGSRVTLHLGVIVQPYRARGKSVKAVDTGQVAQWLENKYGIMEVFWNRHENQAASDLEQGFAGALESLMMGQRIDPFGYAIGRIESAFRTFISSRAAEKAGIPGTPTLAALRGVNHRLRHPYAKANPRRPSFRDTALYMTSFKVWTD